MSNRQSQQSMHKGAGREHPGGGPGASAVEQVWALLEAVPDPEIPVLSVVDLGIVRDVHAGDLGVEVEITPTYSGCPATEVIEASIRKALRLGGFPDARVITVLSPPWTSAAISERGREKLLAYGIAPPSQECRAKPSPDASDRPLQVPCPRCGARITERVSEFGSTPCKAHYKCRECLEPFDYFKCV